MKPSDIRDLGSTIAGGGLGAWLLTTVDWHAIQHGNEVKIGVGLLLIAMGYIMYRDRKPA